MTTILRNVTGSDILITDAGLNLAASFNYTVSPSLYADLAQSNDLVTCINSGSVVVNNGFVDLPTPDAISRIQNTLSINSRYVIQMGYSGIAIVGTYLQFTAGLPSNTNPFVIPEPSFIKAYSFAGSAIGTAIYDVQVNGSTIFSISLANSKKTSAYQLNYALSIGDTITVKCSAGTLLLAVANPLINLFIQTDG